MEDRVIIVDRHDCEVGFAGKMATHRRGDLHRAISIFIFDSSGQLMLQRRALTKYHSGGLWSNTCCSHPRPGEATSVAARRRLQEEMGIECELEEVFSFVYHADLGNGLIEYEFDHVFFGQYDGGPTLNPHEADDWKWTPLAELTTDVHKRPEAYSYWLAASLDRVVSCRA